MGAMNPGRSTHAGTGCPDDGLIQHGPRICTGWLRWEYHDGWTWDGRLIAPIDAISRETPAVPLHVRPGPSRLATPMTGELPPAGPPSSAVRRRHDLRCRWGSRSRRKQRVTRMPSGISVGVFTGRRRYLLRSRRFWPTPVGPPVPSVQVWHRCRSFTVTADITSGAGTGSPYQCDSEPHSAARRAFPPAVHLGSTAATGSIVLSARGADDCRRFVSRWHRWPRGTDVNRRCR